MTTVTMFAGDTKALTIRVLDEAGLEVDLTDATSVRFQVDGPYPVPGEPLVTKSLGAGVELTEPQVGLFVVTLEPADTESLIGLHSFEAEVIVDDGTPVKSTVVSGLLDIERTRIGV